MRGIALPLRALLAASLLALLAGCATTTTTAVWKDPEVGDMRLRSLLVLGVAEDQFARRKYEDALAQALRSEGVNAAAGYRVVPHDGKLTQEQIDTAVASRGFQGVLVTRVIGTGEETVHFPGYYDYYRRPIFDSYYRYYAYTYDRVYRPGYTDTYQTVSLETTLYQAPSGRVAWGMRTKSIDPEALDRLVSDLVRETIENLTTSGLL